jgi:arsenate reductase-like glutaredoxin family protein
LARKVGREEPEIAMKLSTDQDSLTVEALIAAIARSPIVVSRPATLLPAGFEEVDVAILSWIAAEARHMRRTVVLM